MYPKAFQNENQPMQGGTARCGEFDADISSLHVHHECMFTYQSEIPTRFDAK